MFQLATPVAGDAYPVVDPDISILGYADIFEKKFRDGLFSADNMQFMEFVITESTGVLATASDKDYHPYAELHGDLGGRVLFMDTHKAEIKCMLALERVLAEGQLFFDSGKIKASDSHFKGFNVIKSGSKGKGKVETGHNRCAFLRVMFRSHQIDRELAATKVAVVRTFAKLNFLDCTEKGASDEVGSLSRMAREFTLAVEEAEKMLAPWRIFHRKAGKELRSSALTEKLKVCGQLMAE
jgi:hypothetical protein